MPRLTHLRLGKRASVSALTLVVVVAVRWFLDFRFTLSLCCSNPGRPFPLVFGPHASCQLVPSGSPQERAELKGKSNLAVEAVTKLADYVLYRFVWLIRVLYDEQRQRLNESRLHLRTIVSLVDDSDELVNKWIFRRFLKLLNCSGTSSAYAFLSAPLRVLFQPPTCGVIEDDFSQTQSSCALYVSSCYKR
jgi:hypothetical protein